MREGAVAPVVVDPQERRAAVDEQLRRLREVVLLVVLHEVLHDDVGNLRAVREVLDVLRVKRVAPQGVPRVLEVHHAELRRLDAQLLVPAPVLDEDVVHVLGEGRVLEVVHEHRVALLHHLLHERGEYRERLAGAGRAEHQGASEGIDEVHPSVAHLPLVLVAGRQVDGRGGLDERLALLEGLVHVVLLLYESPDLVHGQGNARHRCDVSGDGGEYV